MNIIVRGESLNGIVKNGQELELDRNDINRDDLVVYNDGKGQSIKRCVGLQGDNIKLIENHIYINNVGIATTDNKSLLLEDLNQIHCWNDWLKFTKNKIPFGCIFVVGNILNCIDSRKRGFITKEQIVGRVK